MVSSPRPDETIFQIRFLNGPIVRWPSRSMAEPGHNFRCRRQNRRSAVAEGSGSRQVAIGRPGQGGPGQNKNKGDHVADGTHRTSPLAIWKIGRLQSLEGSKLDATF